MFYRRDFRDIPLFHGVFSQKNLFIFAIFTSLLLFYTLVYSPYIKVFESRNWTKTECLILQSEEHKVTRKSGNRTVNTIIYNLRYQYNVNGKKLYGNRYSISSRKSADGKFYMAPEKKLLVGKIYDCFYNPKNIQDSAIFRDFTNKETSMGTLLSLIPIFGYMLFWIADKARIRRLKTNTNNK